MMRKGIVIGAGRDAIHTIKKAREQGIYVVALDGNPEAEGLKYYVRESFQALREQDHRQD